MTELPLSLGRLLSGALARHAPRPAVVADGRTWTYRELDTTSNRLAHALRDLGVGTGTPVALMMSNGAEYAVADLAVAKLGAAKVPLNDMLSAGEADYILRDSGTAVAVATPSQVGIAMTHLARGEQLRAVVATGSAREAPAGALAWDDLLAGRPDGPPEVEEKPGEVGLLIYTGGTTGRPKGVVHRGDALAVNLLSHRIETEIRPDDRLLLSSPLPHSAGFLLQTALLAGAVTHVERRFDPAGIVDAVHRGVTYLFLVPTMIYRLLDAARDDPRDLSALRTILYGAAPMSPERLREGLDRFGPVFVQLYGQSEAPNFLTRLAREDHVSGDPELLRSCGQPVTLAEVRIVGETGEACAPGEVGEVTARTPYTMTGYHGLPEATREALRDGWLHTGDIGHLDERGYLFLLDRKNDMIITGGMNVYSSEVEAALRQCPGVAQVAVVGVPDPDWGEAVVAYVVLDGDPGLDAGRLAAHCRAALSAYKRPKAFRFVDALPLTAVGKVDKKALRAPEGDHSAGDRAIPGRAAGDAR